METAREIVLIKRTASTDLFFRALLDHPSKANTEEPSKHNQRLNVNVCCTEWQS